ncbi:GNAT family N-acetyltransferase [Hymenobacter aerilatus]|uniref:GNAT family N-acetyltransferase n=1 Tax=Hymenobacter aerilatus TaxID=2932251 RepID=A0A8T9T0A5_9BACT|nr:GNAT family N-acetyltransferase [Hymenobacter aerilatus]UOR07287.1 GNAT family N-acetyltransferase [Hymenobacter aerilatus]
MMPNDFQIKRYTPDCAHIWNELIEQSVNGSFMLKRSFMEYHQDRFDDFSCLIWKGSKLLAVFVAALPKQRVRNEHLIAHPGLTYGGVVTASDLQYLLLEELYGALFDFLKQHGFISLTIKLIPRVFCREYSDNGLFVLHKNGFALKNRELNSVIDLTQPFNIGSRQKNNLRKARKSNVQVGVSERFDVFWPILTDNLWQVHGVKPVHTLAEITYLHERHPENIELYVAQVENRILAGVVVFKEAHKGYLHSQYISTNAEGRLVGAVDAILYHILQQAQGIYQRLSFGISTVKGEVNYGLLSYKEGFGAKGEVVETYTKVL